MKHLSEFIYGGMDGIITTVAIIGAGIGSGLPNKYISILGSSSLLADGFSMGVSRYNSLIESKDSSCKEGRINPIMSGIYTFVYFVCLGIIPLLPFFIFNDKRILHKNFLIFSILSFMIVGYIKGKKTKNKNILFNMFQTLTLGMIAVLISYSVSYKIKQYIA